MKRRTRLGRIPSMKQEPTDALGALFGPHMHDSSQDVLDLLRKLEWRGDNVNHHGYRGFCPSCGNNQATGHRTDCELNKVLTGPGPRIAGHLVEQNQRLERELAEAQKQNAALQKHNTEQVELRREAEAELRQANLCLDANRAEVSKLSSLVNEHLGRGRRLQGELSEVLKRENLTKQDLAAVLVWARDMHDMARHGLALLAAALGLYSSPVYPDAASLYAELFKLMSSATAARVTLHPLTNPKE